jgi:hypothetical protein
MHPFAEIEVTPLFSRDGMKSQGQSVRIADEDSAGGWKELGVVSTNYLLIHNSQVKNTVDDIAYRSPFQDWTQRKMFFDGKRFIYSITTDSIAAEVAPGDLVRFGLIAYNSYDGSRAVSVGAYAEHLVCSNGMTSEMYFARFTFRHHLGNLNWEEQTGRAFSLLLPDSQAKLQDFATSLGSLKKRDLTLADLRLLRREHMQDLAVSLWGKVLDRYLLHEARNAFGFLDACTHVFWHSEKETMSDYRNNSYATDAMLNFARRLN